MNRTNIKICGIRTVDAAAHLASLDVDYAGFVFTPESRRAVTPAVAASLAKQLPSRIGKVGVFVDSPPSLLEEAVTAVDLSVLQLHGSEDESLCDLIRDRGMQVWKAWRVRGSELDQRVYAYEGHIDALLLDAYHPNAAGGTGTAFDWEIIAEFRSRMPLTPLIIAGGLRADNVGELIQKVLPYGVDVSSGIETDGKQDLDKIRSFVQKVRETDGLPR